VVQSEERVGISLGCAHRQRDVLDICPPVRLKDILARNAAVSNGQDHGFSPSDLHPLIAHRAKKLGYCLLHEAGHGYTTISGQYPDPPDQIGVDVDQELALLRHILRRPSRLFDHVSSPIAISS
jgi:hypothetical protein